MRYKMTSLTKVFAKVGLLFYYEIKSILSLTSSMSHEFFN